MEIKKPAVAGTMESSDCQITIRPGQGDVGIELQSDVERMFGESILHTVRATLEEMGVSSAEVSIVDKGAMDCVIRARLQCAVCRGLGQSYDWEKEGACHG